MITTAAELRAAFDRTFAEALPVPVPRADVLAIQAGGAGYAVPQAQLAALRLHLVVVGVPSPAPALLGVAVVHGAIIPVWDLAQLLGGSPGGSRRWCAIVCGESAALAFDQLDGHLRLPVPIGATVAHRERAYRVLDALDLVGRAAEL